MSLFLGAEGKTAPKILIQQSNFRRFTVLKTLFLSRQEVSYFCALARSKSRHGGPISPSIQET